MKAHLFYAVFFTATLISAKTINVSTSKGFTTAQKLTNAYEKAKSGDEVLLDIDVLISGKLPFVMYKNNVNLKGGQKKKGKFKIYRNDNHKITVNVLASQVAITNIQIEEGVQGLVLGSKQRSNSKNVIISNCDFKNCQYTGVNFYGNHTGVTIDYCNFYDCKFSLQTLDCKVLKNFKISNCEFHEGDHQISLDNPHVKKPKHENISIENCTFHIAERFNIALANTQNVVIKDCTMAGGRKEYSQGLHFEDRSENIYVLNNTINNKNDCAVLSYATDKIGHGQGRKLTEKEKRAAGCKNITLKNNIINGGGKNDAAISITYGRGFFKIEGDNKITSDQQGIKINTSQNLMLKIDTKAVINDQIYQEILTFPKLQQESKYLKIR